MLADRTQEITQSIFRTYDIRGIVDKTLREEDVYLIGKAIGSVVRDRGDSQIAVGRDGRTSGPRLVHALCKGILSSGCNVVDIGMVPTPVLYYAAHVLKEKSGVMLTGSHNPSDYNGLKTVIQGVTLSEEDIQDLYQRIKTGRLRDGAGTLTRMNITDLYVSAAAANIKMARPLKIVVDAGNGVTGQIAPQLFRALGCEVHEIFCEIDGEFPNHHPDPSQPENLAGFNSCRARSKKPILVWRLMAMAIVLVW